MFSFTTSKGSLTNATAELIVVGATGGADSTYLDAGGEELESAGAGLLAALESVGFEAKAGNTARVPLGDAAKASSVLVIGLGDAPTLDGLRKAAAIAVRSAGTAKSMATSLAISGGEATDVAAGAQAVVEGAILGAYDFTDFKSKPEAKPLKKIALHNAGLGKPQDLKTGVTIGQATGSAQALARDLVNTPPGDKRPPALADRARETVKGTGIKVKILNDDQLKKGGYGGLVGVGQGSSEGPRLVQLTYAPAGAKKHVALVGKGITFDTGGISIKPSSSMLTMKMDMGGAACVLAAITAVAELKLKVKVTAIMALAENMPSGTAQRPSDVITILGGTTVEVLNTDAEGRLVLADALVHASKLKPDVIVDLATLTGAVIVALGPKIGAVISNDEELAGQILAAGTRVSEPFAELPLSKDLYADDMKSDTADIKNAYMGEGAGTIKAGLFLEHFVGEGIPWAHLDIAGIAWTTTDDGYASKGATGAPVRTLIDWLSSL